MAKGRKPKPSHLKVLQGTDRADRKVNEPEPEPSIPEMPEWFDEYAEAEWQRIVPELAEHGLLTNIDRAALAGYCAAWSAAVRAEQQLEEEGDTFQTGTGQIKQHPAQNIRDKAWSRVDRFGAGFGLSPSSRSRINVAPQGQRDKEDWLFRGAK